MATPQPFDARAVARLLAEYDGFGLRRAGSPGDAACAKWLGALIDVPGAVVESRPVALPVIEVHEACLELAGLRIDGLPMFDAPATPESGVQGSIGPAEGDAAIGFLAVDPGAASIKGQPLELLRRASTRSAIVLATRGAGGSLAPVNAQYHTEPFGPPVLQVAGSEEERLQRAVREGATVRVTIRLSRRDGRSENLAARVGDAPPQRVLLTPRTSWWESTAERAGGIVAWAAALQAAAASGTPVHGYSTCGHELGHIGLGRLLEEAASLLTPSTTWLHLGANLGCATDPRLTLRASDASDAKAFHALLVASGVSETLIEIEPIERAMGEARDLDLHGARVVSIIGRNGHFHAPSDRWPGNVSAALVSSIARAAAAWAVARR